MGFGKNRYLCLCPFVQTPPQPPTTRRARHEAERKRDELFLQVGNLKPSRDFLSSELDKAKSDRESAEAHLIDSFRKEAQKEGIHHIRAESWYQGTM